VQRSGPIKKNGNLRIIMASLLDMAQARLQGLLDIPARAGRALVDPTVFSGLLGAPTLPKERGIAQAAYGLPPEPNMSVLNPEQAAYMQGYAQGEPLSYLGLLAPFTAPAAVAGAKAVAPQAGMALENYMARQGMLQNIVPEARKLELQESLNKIAGGEKPVRSAVVLIGDKIFTGNTHTQAFEKAIQEGVVRKEGKKFIYPEGAEVNSDLFMLNDGRIVDRLEASKLLDIGASETALRENKMQIRPANSMSIDEYMRQAEEIKKARNSTEGLLD
jgi:hypothetical protein